MYTNKIVRRTINQQKSLWRVPSLQSSCPSGGSRLPRMRLTRLRLYGGIFYHDIIWLVFSTPLKNISQLGWLLPRYGKIKHFPNHQPVIHAKDIHFIELHMDLSMIFPYFTSSFLNFPALNGFNMCHFCFSKRGQWYHSLLLSRRLIRRMITYRPRCPNNLWNINGISMEYSWNIMDDLWHI